MPYKDEYHPRIKSDLKKLDKHVVKEIYNTHISRLKKRNENVTENILNDLKG